MVDKIFAGSLAEGRTAATTTLIVLGLCFILLLERGPGREHITIQSYMLALVAGLGALYALGPRRRRRCASSSTSSCSRPGSGSCRLLSVAVGLLLAAAAWRVPYIQALEAPAEVRRRRAGARGAPTPPDDRPRRTRRSPDRAAG